MIISGILFWSISLQHCQTFAIDDSSQETPKVEVQTKIVHFIMTFSEKDSI